MPSDEKYLTAIERLVEKEIPRVESPWSPPGGGNKPATDEASPEQTEEHPKRTRSRGGRGRNKSERPAEDTAPFAAAPEAQAAAAPAEPAPKRDNAGGARSRGGRGRSGGQDNRVVGLGDHLPGFIALSFEERREENAG